MQHEGPLIAALAIVFPNNFNILNMGRHLFAGVVDIDDTRLIDPNPCAIEIGSVLAGLIDNNSSGATRRNDSPLPSAPHLSKISHHTHRRLNEIQMFRHENRGIFLLIFVYRKVNLNSCTTPRDIRRTT